MIFPELLERIEKDRLTAFFRLSDNAVSYGKIMKMDGLEALATRQQSGRGGKNGMGLWLRMEPYILRPANAY
jgi:hypothetical protein